MAITLQPNRAGHGFTLAEMSIVLVIIGLVVGGILGGQEMLHTADLQRVVTEKDKIFIATENFRVKYHALPGDFKEATNFWGINAAGCPAGNSITGTCNGNGNGTVDWAGWATQSEGYRFWQHLSLSNIYPGRYTGAVVPTTFVEVGQNVPEIPMGGFWIVQNVPESTASFSRIGNAVVAAGTFANNANFVPQDAYRIDVKSDDGMPATGKISTATTGLTPDCAVGTSLTTPYNINHKDPACLLYFWME